MDVSTTYQHVRNGESGVQREVSQSLSLVLPAFNEEESICDAVREAMKALASVADDFEILVVDDGSTDHTAAIVERLSSTYPNLRLVRHATNRGYGAAIQTGFREATKELVAFTDADCQFDLQEMDRFLLLSKDYDLVCGYRIDRQDTWLRCFVSRGFNVLARLLLGIRVRDIDCAFKVFRRKSIQALPVSADGFLINTELLMRAAQQELSIVEVGVTHRSRDLGKSTVSMSHIVPVLICLLRLWWNESMFAGVTPFTTIGMIGDSRDSKRSTRWATLLVAVVSAILLYSNLNYPLLDRDETRYAEIPREMVMSGNWVLPQLNFEPYYDKPPLLYWLCATSFQTFGISERSARLVPATAGFALVMLTFWFGHRTFGLRAALLGSVVLLTSAGFLFCGRFLFIDALLSLLVSASLIFAFEAIRSDTVGWRWWLLSATCCGLGVLAKGPIAGVLVGPPVLVFAWFSTSHASIQLRHWLAFAAVSIGMAIPWFIAVSFQDPNFLYEFFYHHNVQRFALAGAYHKEAFWYFLPVFLAAGHPWTCIVLPLVVFLAKKSAVSRRLRLPVIGFLLLWIGWCLLFFSLSNCKLPAYILPVTPAFALIAGYYLEQVLFGNCREKHFQYARWILPWTASVTTCVVGVVLGCVAYRKGGVLPVPLVWKVLPWLIAGCLLMAFRQYTRHPKIVWSICALTALAAVFQTTQDWVPAISRQQSMLPADSEFAFLLRDPDITVATFRNEWSAVPFYLGRTDVANFDRDEVDLLVQYAAANDRTVLFVNRSQDIEVLEEAIPASVTLTRIGVRGDAAIVELNRFGNTLRTASIKKSLAQANLTR